MLKRTCLLIFFILILTNNVFSAERLFWANDLVSGGEGAINKPFGQLDGSNLLDGDYVIAMLKNHAKFGNRVMFYVLDATSGEDEDWTNYTIIAPGSNAGLKRWKLVDPGKTINEEGVYLYVAYASNSSGANFTTNYNDSLDYIGFLQSDTAIDPLYASHFAGLWKNYKGTAGLGFDECDATQSDCYIELPENDNHVAAPLDDKVRIYKYNGHLYLINSTGGPIQLD